MQTLATCSGYGETLGRALELGSVSWFISFLITLFFLLLPGLYSLINDREEVFYQAKPMVLY